MNPPTADGATPEQGVAGIVALLETSWGARRALLVVYLALIATSALAGVMFALSSAQGIGALRTSGSLDLAAVRRPLVMAGAYLGLQQLAIQILDLVTFRLARASELEVRHRLMRLARAVDSRALESQANRDRYAVASLAGDGRFGVSAAVQQFVPNALAYTSWASFAVLLMTLSVWWGLMLAAIWLAVRTEIRRSNEAAFEALNLQSMGARRRNYFRELASSSIGAKEIRVYRLARWIREKYDDHARVTASRVDTAVAGAGKRIWWLIVLTAVAHTVVFGAAAAELSQGELPVRDFALLVLCVMGLTQLLPSGTGEDVLLSRTSASVAALRELEHEFLLVRRELPEIAKVRSQQTGRATAPSVELIGVSFSYGERPIFDGLNLKIPAGTSTAIVGENGAGKTTLVRLISGLLVPDNGSVLIDESPLEADLEAHWRRVATVFQDFVRLPLSLRDNVRFFEPGSDLGEETLVSILKEVGLDDAVHRLPYGVDTPLGALGAPDLSGGEWQRLILARALWAVESGRTLLILDEPTANLDPQAEERFYSDFVAMTRGTTSIVISHRFPAVRACGRIAVLDAGKIAELGTHQALVRGARGYAAAYEAQAAAFRDA